MPCSGDEDADIDPVVLMNAPPSRDSTLRRRRAPFVYFFSFAVAFVVFPGSGPLAGAPQFALFDAWTPANEELDGNLANGPEPHFVYAIGVTWNDTLLIACEGRLAHKGDGGAKYLLVRRSTDQAATWSRDIVIEGGDGASWTNPAFVTDGTTIYLFYGSTLTGTKTLHYKTSTDNGQTWSTRRNINQLWGETFPNDWVQHGTIGHGIKKLKDPNRGRLLLAFSHRARDVSNAVTGKIGVDLIYHDPDGAWSHAGGIQPPMAQEGDGAKSNDVGPGESRVAERADGSLLLIARKRWNSASYTRARAWGTSIEHGVDWSDWANATGIVGCNFVDGGFLRFSDICHLYSFPNNPGSSTRRNLSVAASPDGGITWGTPKLIYGGDSNYSDLARDSQGNIYCVFGRDGGSHNIDPDPTKPAARVTVARFNLEWVTGINTPTIVIDDGASGFSTEGAWNSSAAAPGYYGSGYRDSTSPGNMAAYTPTITVAGNYEVFIRWTGGSDRPAAAPVEIQYDGGHSTATTTVNQKVEGGSWYYLGTFNLSAGTGNSVKLSTSDAGTCVADAVMFQKQ